MKKLLIGACILGFININSVQGLASEYKQEEIHTKKAKSGNIITEVFQDYEGMSSLTKLKKETDEKFEVGISKKYKNYEFIAGEKNYQKARETLKGIKINEGEEGFILNEKGHIIYSTNGLGRIVNLYNDNYEYTTKHVIKVYPTKESNSHITYINSGYVDDVPILEFEEKRVKILVNGVEGWINIEENGYTNIVVVPLNKAKNISYYSKNESGDLIHYISTNLESTGKGHKIIIGKAPNWMKKHYKYYSYDGNYFYDNIEDLIQDEKKNSNSNAINKSEMFYNYYLYLPLRSKTTYTSTELNKYLKNKTPEKSILKNIGTELIEAQEKYGVNAGIVLGIAMNESAKGTSQIALEKNNIFGLNAIDSNTDEANKFNSVKDCINDFSKNWMSNKYLNFNNWVYNGGSLGNKDFGINVQYASDPFWAEKASRYYYEIDKYLGLEDLSNYKIGIFRGENKVTDSNGNLIYEVRKVKNKSARVGYTTTILDLGSDKYQVYPERQSGQATGEYDWSSKGYISKTKVEIINDGGWYIKNGVYHYKKYNGKDAIGWEIIDDEWYFFDEFGRMQTGWKFINSKWYFLNENGAMRTGWIWDSEIENWYYLKENGEIQIGWKFIDGVWYNFGSEGIMQTGWIFENKEWYYLESNGQMSTGWIKIDNTWYFFNDGGTMKTGWLRDSEYETWYYAENNGVLTNEWKFINGEWYKLNENGVMETGWMWEEGEWYLFNENGVMSKGWEWKDSWYLFDNSGKMKTGWIFEDGYWYLLKESGEMNTEWTWDDGWYYFNHSGKMQVGWNYIDENWYYMYQNGIMATNVVIDGWYLDYSGIGEVV